MAGKRQDEGSERMLEKVAERAREVPGRVFVVAAHSSPYARTLLLRFRDLPAVQALAPHQRNGNELSLENGSRVRFVVADPGFRDRFRGLVVEMFRDPLVSDARWGEAYHGE